MPAETERKPSDPTANEPTLRPDPAAGAADRTAEKKAAGLGRLFKRSKRNAPTPVDEPAADTDPTEATSAGPRSGEAGSADTVSTDDTVTVAGVGDGVATRTPADDAPAADTSETKTTTEPTENKPADAKPNGTKSRAETSNSKKSNTKKSSAKKSVDTQPNSKQSTTDEQPKDEQPNDERSEDTDDTAEQAAVAPAPVAGDDTEATSERTAAVEPSAPHPRQVWRCTRSTITLVIVLMVVVGIAIPAAAALSLWLGVTGFGDQQVLVLSVIGGLALLTLFFGWRLGLHPRLIADGAELTIVNPFRTHRLDFADITHFAPGGDGLMVGTADEEIDAWCIQKSTGAIKAERLTRADKITDELWTIRDSYHRPVEVVDEPRPAEIRFAHQDDAELLTQLERSASLARLGHIFPPDRYGFPEEDIRERWRAVLDDRTRQTMIAEVDGEPAGYVSIGLDTVHHMGVGEGHQRRGIGSELLAAAEEELFADVATPEIELWVLEDNEVARTFYRDHGWTDTEDERDAEFPPYPNEIRMVRRNPHLARRGR